MKRNVLLFMFSCLIFCDVIIGQAEITVIDSGLRSPVGIDPDNMGSYFVAQAGTGQNDGEIS